VIEHRSPGNRHAPWVCTDLRVLKGCAIFANPDGRAVELTDGTSGVGYCTIHQRLVQLVDGYFSHVVAAQPQEDPCA
jgi:hypothetical protein